MHHLELCERELHTAEGGIYIAKTRNDISVALGDSDKLWNSFIQVRTASQGEILCRQSQLQSPLSLPKYKQPNLSGRLLTPFSDWSGQLNRQSLEIAEQRFIGIGAH